MPFARALRHAIAEAGTERGALIDVAKKLLAQALEGDLAAIREVADRLDGKPMQSTDLTIYDNRIARDVDDAELLDIAAGGSAGATGPTDGASVADAVH